MDGVKWNVRVFAEGWMEWNEMDMDPHVGPYVDLCGMDWNPAANRRPYTIAVSFINGRTESHYEWCLRRLQFLGVYSPVWVVDAEIAESNAIRKVFPSATIILCRWPGW